VQKLFSLHAGTHLLTARIEGVENLNARTRALNVSTTLDQDAGEAILKVVNVSSEMQTLTVTLDGVTQAGPLAEVIGLASDYLTDENSLDNPRKIAPTTSSIPVAGTGFSYGFAPYSMTIIRVPVK
jgi:alpha-L-arabinofuranosidase